MKYIGDFTSDEIITNGNWFLGAKLKVIINGKETSRRVYDDAMCGLYILINGCKVFMYEFE